MDWRPIHAPEKQPVAFGVAPPTREPPLTISCVRVSTVRVIASQAGAGAVTAPLKNARRHRDARLARAAPELVMALEWAREAHELRTTPLGAASSLRGVLA